MGERGRGVRSLPAWDERPVGGQLVAAHAPLRGRRADLADAPLALDLGIGILELYDALLTQVEQHYAGAHRRRGGVARGSVEDAEDGQLFGLAVAKRGVDPLEIVRRVVLVEDGHAAEYAVLEVGRERRGRVEQLDERGRLLRAGGDERVEHGARRHEADAR